MKRFELLPDETLLICQPKHWRNVIMPFLTIGLSFFVLFNRILQPELNVINGIIRRDLVPESVNKIFVAIEAITALAVIFVMVYKILSFSYTRYYVTDRRIIAISGMLEVSYQEMLLNKCEMVYLHMDVVENIFSSGDIVCVSAGTNIVLNDVYNAVAFKQEILKLISERRDAE